MSEPKQISRLRAFTLVELLVVIGIIALLISILLPAINRAKISAMRIKCSSNLRQVYTSFLMYSNDNQGQVPLGHRREYQQYNYMIFNDNVFIMFGAMVYRGYGATNPQVWYCPSQNSPFHMLDNADNPWPRTSGNVLWKPPLATIGGVQTRAGYSMRGTDPDWNDISWPDSGAAVTSGDPIKWPTIKKCSNNPLTDDSLYATLSSKLPTLQSYKSKAIFCDVISADTRVKPSHRDVVDVCYADGSVKSVKTSAISKQLAQLPNSFSSSANLPIKQIWDIFDKN